MKNKTRKIYTEKIHHVSCVSCDDYSNTNDAGHELSKTKAAEMFECEGWGYVKNKGWFCPDCFNKLITNWRDDGL